MDLECHTCKQLTPVSEVQHLYEPSDHGLLSFHPYFTRGFLLLFSVSTNLVGVGSSTGLSLLICPITSSNALRVAAVYLMFVDVQLVCVLSYMWCVYGT